MESFDERMMRLALSEAEKARAEHLAAARGSVVTALLPAVPDPERLIDGRDIFYGYALADKMLGNIGTVFGKRRIVLLFYIFSKYLMLVEMRLVVIRQAFYRGIDEENDIVRTVADGTAHHIDRRGVARPVVFAGSGLKALGRPRGFAECAASAVLRPAADIVAVDAKTDALGLAEKQLADSVSDRFAAYRILMSPVSDYLRPPCAARAEAFYSLISLLFIYIQLQFQCPHVKSAYIFHLILKYIIAFHGVKVFFTEKRVLFICVFKLTAETLKN